MLSGRPSRLRPAALLTLALFALVSPEGSARPDSAPGGFTAASGPAGKQLDRAWWLGPNGINALPLRERVRGQGAVVAIVDTGVRFEIPALAGRAWVGEEIADNETDDDGNGIVDDAVGVDAVDARGSQVYTDGHGTVVASIVASSHPAAPGVAPESKIVPVSLLHQGEPLKVSDGIRALLLLARRPEVNVINLSWGVYGFGCSVYLDQFERALAALAAQQKLVVAPAGNNPFDLDQEPFCPAVATVPTGLVVTASNPDSTIAPWAGRGARSVNAIAPGNFLQASTEDGGINDFAGTSFSAPLVAGTAALLFSLRPHASAAEVRAAILNSQRPAAAATQQFGDTLVSPALVGGGIVDATKAAQLLESDTTHVPTAFEQLSARVVRVAKGGRIGVRWSPSYDGRLSGYGVKLRCLRCARKVKQRWVHVDPTRVSARVAVATAGEYEVSVTAFDEDGHSVSAS